MSSSAASRIAVFVSFEFGCKRGFVTPDHLDQPMSLAGYSLRRFGFTRPFSESFLAEQRHEDAAAELLAPHPPAVAGHGDELLNRARPDGDDEPAEVSAQLIHERSWDARRRGRDGDAIVR